MKKLAGIALTCSIVAGAGSALATNGSNLIGIGPVSRAMGGVGIAMPQDSITAIFQNPAALGACPCGAQSESIFGATVFDPTVKAKITLPTPNGPITLKDNSGGQPYVIPAIGVTMSANEKIRVGVGAYGVSGMGVDYRNNHWDLDGNPANGYEGDLYTQLQVMKFAGMASYQIMDDLALGISLNGTYNALNLGQGISYDYTFGAQLGLLWRVGMFAIGATYTMPETANYRKVYNFDAFMGDSYLDDLKLESPQTFGIGIAAKPAEKLCLEFDTKYIDWASTDGYGDFDWESQWTFALGAEFEASDKLQLRCGYNYGSSPVDEHNGWNPEGVKMVQGKAVPQFGYEMLRTIGFPAVVESHLSIGASYKLTQDLSVHLGYMHAFENSISETSAGGPYGVTLSSKLAEDTYSFSLAWAF